MQSNLKIYTRTGDLGKTSLYGGKRVYKDNFQVEAYGTVDELNSHIGILISYLSDKDVISYLKGLQSDLFGIGAYLAGGKNFAGIDNKVTEIEKKIDEMTRQLTPLKNFILPGGSKEAAFAHMARSVTRRVERKILTLLRQNENLDKKILIYFNRLSDYFFVLARFLNQKAGIKDVIWKT